MLQLGVSRRTVVHDLGRANVRAAIDAIVAADEMRRCARYAAVPIGADLRHLKRDRWRECSDTFLFYATYVRSPGLARANRCGFVRLCSSCPHSLTNDEKRAIELEEDLRRKDLTPHERSKTIADFADAARQIAEAEAETCSGSEQVFRTQRGPARTPGSLRDIAERTGIPTTTIHHARAHVAAAERYPELSLPHIPQDHALAIAASLDNLPDDERPALLARLRQNDRPLVAALDRTYRTVMTARST